MTSRRLRFGLASLLFCLLLPVHAAAQETVSSGLTWMTGYPSTWNAGAPKLVSDGLFYYAVFCGRGGSEKSCTVARKRGDATEEWTFSTRTFTSNQPATVVIDRKGRLNIFFNDFNGYQLRHIRLDHPSVNLVDWTAIPTGFAPQVGYIHASYEAVSDQILVTFNETSTWQLYLARKVGDANWTISPLPAAPSGSMFLYARTVAAQGRYFVLAGLHTLSGQNFAYTSATLFESTSASGPWTAHELHRATGNNLGVPYENWVLANDLQVDAAGHPRALLHITELGSGHANPLDGLYLFREENGYASPTLIGSGIEDGYTLYVDPSGVHLAFVRDQVPVGSTTQGGIRWYRSNNNGATWQQQAAGYARLVNPALVDLRSGSMIGPDLRFLASDQNLSTNAFDAVMFAGVTLSPAITDDRYAYEYLDDDGTVDYVRAFRDVPSGRFYYYMYDRNADLSYSVSYTYTAGSYYQVYTAGSNGSYHYYNSDGVDVSEGPPTLVPAATTVNSGAVATFAVANGPGNQFDWVGWFCPTSAADTAYIDWKYLSNSRTPPATGTTAASITFTTPSSGSCQARLFADNGFVKLVTSATITVATVSAPAPTATTLTPASVMAGSAPSILVTGTNFVAASVVNVNGAARATTFLSSTQLRVSLLAGDVPTAGVNASIVVVTPAPGGGTSNIVLLSVASGPTLTSVYGGVLVGTGLFTVANGPGNPTDWVGWYCPSTEPDQAYTNWKYLNDSKVAPAAGLTSGTVSFAVPPGGGGTCQARLFANNGFSRLAISGSVLAGINFDYMNLTIAARDNAPGGTFGVSYYRDVSVSYPPRSLRDWVGLFCPASNGNMMYVDWKYLNDSQTAPTSFGAGYGSATLTTSMPPGTKCQARLFDNGGFFSFLTSWTVTVASPTLTPASLAVAPSSPIAVAVAAGPANPRDWVGLFCPAGNGDMTYLDWKYLGNSKTPPGSGLAAATVTFTAPAAATACQLRLFADDGFTLLAASDLVIVQ